jgi:hypothetical protein
MTATQIRHRASHPQKRKAESASKNSKTTTDSNRAASRTVELNINIIQRCHNIGSDILKLCGEYAPRNEMGKLAAKYEIPEGAARRFRQIARMYSQAELDKLYQQFRKKNFAFSVTHFFISIGVGKTGIRKKLAQDAVRGKLGIEALRKLKLKIAGNSTGAGGRRPKVVTHESKQDLRAAIHFESVKWQQSLERLLGEPKMIEPALKKRLDELRGLVQKVHALSGQ